MPFTTVAAPTNRSDGGFTLTETIGSAAILTVAVMALMQTQVSNLNVASASRSRTLATSELRSCMETALAMSVDEILATGSPFVEGMPVAEFTDRALPSQQIVVAFPNYDTGDPIPAQLFVRLTIDWADNTGRAQSLTATAAMRR